MLQLKPNCECCDTGLTSGIYRGVDMFFRVHILCEMLVGNLVG